MFGKLYKPHSLIVTMMILLIILLMNFVRLNLHFIDPFNYSLKEYETTDIVFSQLQPNAVTNESRIILVNTTRPDRTTLSRLIDHVAATSPKVVGIDILLEGRKDEAGDSLLQASLKRNDNIVLGVALKHYVDSLQLFEGVARCDTFFANHAHLGYVNFPANDTRTIRYFSPEEQTFEGQQSAFATQIAKLYDPEAIQRLKKRDNKLEQINYIGDSLSFAHYTDLEEFMSIPAEDLKPVFKDKIILLGFLGEKGDNEIMLDKFFTPLNPRYSGRSTPDMYGLFIHANIISMIINGEYIYQVPYWLSTLMGILFCYINVIVMHRIYHQFHEAFHGIARLIQMVEFLLLFLISALLFYFFKVKLEFSLGIIALILAYDIVMIYESLIKRRIPWLQKIK